MTKLNCPDCEHKFTRNGPTGSGRKQRYICKKSTGGCGYSTTDPTAKSRKRQDGTSAEKRRPLVFKRALKGVKRFIITAAQNATPVHEKFLKSLELAANDKNAELVVVPIRYKNPTSRFPASQSNEEYWDEKVQPYLYNARRNLNKHLILLGDIKTQPTAVSPLSGFESITHSESGILAHTKLQLMTIPTPQSSRLPKILTTTGAVTIPNYTDTKTGKLGEFHHTQAAVMVEISGSKFHIRQLNATKDGSFYDIDTAYGVDYMKDGISRNMPVAAIALGDSHVDFADPKVTRATFGEGGIIEATKPGVIVWHDVHDGYGVNPHHKNNVFNAIAKRITGQHLAEEEVKRACEFMEKHTPKDALSLIVASNHGDFLRRYIINTDWREDPDNAAFYLETALAMVRGTKMTEKGTEYPDPFTYWARRLLPKDNFRVLDTDESYMVEGVELSMHGDKGPNGARGSRHNLRRIGVKSIIGHSHSPGIEEGCYQVGTSSRLRLEYNSGPSSWLHTHCLLYKNGKRSLVNIIDGEWRLK